MRSPEKDHRVQILVFKNLRIYYYKKVKMADNLGPNGLVVSAPFLGTALDEYKQSIEPAVSCHFHLLFIPIYLLNDYIAGARNLGGNL